MYSDFISCKNCIKVVYLADVVVGKQDIPCCNVSVYKVLSGKVLHPQGYLLGKAQQHLGALRRHQLSRAVWQ